MGGSPGSGGVLEGIRVCRGCWFLVDSNSKKEFQGSREGEGERDLGGGALEMSCGLRQNSREGNSREEWMGEVGAWVGGDCGGDKKGVP